MRRKRGKSRRKKSRGVGVGGERGEIERGRG